MATLLAGVETSSVQIEDRKALALRAGDTVRIHQKIVDKGKTRIQVFEGLVLARKHGDEPGATFTVRKVSQGIGVEKIFPLYSPLIEKIEIIKRSKVRRAKLYYIREKVAREIKRQMRRMSLVSLATESETDATARIEAEAEAQAKEKTELEVPAETQAEIVEDKKVDLVTETQSSISEVKKIEEIKEEPNNNETPVVKETSKEESK